MKNKVELLRVKEREGRALLQMRPLDKDAYKSWSDSAREAVEISLGTSSDQLKDLLKARRAISVRYEIDPSYHLTQVGANLRRELSVLRQCIAHLGEAAAPEAFRRPAKVAASLLQAGDGAGPASSRSSTRPEAREARLLVLLHHGTTVDRAVRSDLESLKPSGIHSVDDARVIERILKGDEEATCGIVVLPDGDGRAHPHGANGSPSLPAAQAVFALGVLAGSFGPERVCVLHPEGVSLPSEDTGILHVSLQDPGGWRTRIVEHLRRVGLKVQ